MVLIDISFLDMIFWDVLIVGIERFQVYQYWQGILAQHILAESMVLYVICRLFISLNMDVWSANLIQLVSIDVIFLIMMFQPKFLKFLLSSEGHALNNPYCAGILTRFLGLALGKVDSSPIVDETLRGIQPIRKSQKRGFLVPRHGMLTEINDHSATYFRSPVSTEKLASKWT